MCKISVRDNTEWKTLCFRVKTCCIQAEETCLAQLDKQSSLLFEGNFSEKNSAGLYRPIWHLVMLQLENFLVLLLKKKNLPRKITNFSNFILTELFHRKKLCEA